MFGLAVLTVSTSGSQGKRDDSSGQAIKDLLEGDDFQVVRYEIVTDDKDTISAKLAEWADAEDVDLIVTTGGTGLGRYDVTDDSEPRMLMPQPFWNTMTRMPYAAATDSRLRIIAFAGITIDRNITNNKRNARPRTNAKT